MSNMAWAILIPVSIAGIAASIWMIASRRRSIREISAFLALPENKAGVTSAMVCDALDINAAEAYATLTGMVDRGEIASEHRGRRRYYWVNAR